MDLWIVLLAALLVGVLGAPLLYIDARARRIPTAGMWACAFFFGVFVPPVIGAVAVGLLYLYRRDMMSRKPETARHS